MNWIQVTMIQNHKGVCPFMTYVYRILIPYGWTDVHVFSIISYCDKELALYIVQI